jgi:hypothetical protein
MTFWAGNRDGRMEPLVILQPATGEGDQARFALKFAGALAKCVGLPEEFRRVATELGCHFFNPGSVTGSSIVDGIHPEADQHAVLGRILAQMVGSLLGGTSA